MSMIPEKTAVQTASSRWGKLGLAPRRVANTWRSAEEMGQPQDGALQMDDAPSVKAIGPMQKPALREPEDAGLTGGTRSLMRRVLGLNVTKAAVKPITAVSLRKLPLSQASAA